jgi:hypothetical protein
VGAVAPEQAARDNQLPIRRSSRTSSAPGRSLGSSREQTPPRPDPAVNRKKKGPDAKGSGAAVAAAGAAEALVDPAPRPRLRKADQDFESPFPTPVFIRMKRAEHSAKPSH